MLVKVHKDDKESNERCITRFNKAVQASRKIMKLKSERYHSKKSTKRKTRSVAVMREFHRSRNNRNRFYAAA